MTLQSTIVAQASGVLVISDPSEISKIGGAGIPGLIWQRAPLAGFQDWIDALDPAALPRARVILRPGDAGRAAAEACASAGTPEAPERARLVDDIAALADVFAKALQVRWLRLRLDVVDTDACRRFHVDRITARLICTYRGTGTQYGISTGAEPEVVHTARTGSPFVMRGALWPAQPDPGLLHRSPPIEGTGETRLVLVLDPVTDPENEA
ncbi:DUF1826 domain-containing protein [Roseovarius sp. S1116L3]|uniref:DUF1826 domain-containing protein n=1 Tax=Roseovarius roseus TaxID=3342636 RepID=UPI0037273FD7